MRLSIFNRSKKIANKALKSNVTDILTRKAIVNNTLGSQKEESIENHMEYCFNLPFSGHYFFCPAVNGLGHCKVTVKKGPSCMVHVMLDEPHDTGSTSVTNRIEHIATQIYWGFLQGHDPRYISWTIKYEQDRFSKQFNMPQSLYWDGHRFFYHRPEGRVGKKMIESPMPGTNTHAGWEEKPSETINTPLE